MSPRYGIVTRAYPRAYRDTHAAELIQTANELAPDRWSPRQSRSFLVEGLRTRAKLSANGSTTQIWGTGIAVALGLTFMLWTAFPLVHLFGAREGVTILWPYSPWLYLAQGLVPLAALTWSTRWPTALIITATNTVLAIGALQSDTAIMQSLLQTNLAFLLATSALAWWLATRTDGRRAFAPPAALLLLTALVILSSVADGPGLAPAVVLIQFGPLILGLALVTIDPRPLIAATTYFALTSTTMLFSLVNGEAFRSENGIVAAVPVAFLGATAMLSRFGTRRLLAT